MTKTDDSTDNTLKLSIGEDLQVLPCHPSKRNVTPAQADNPVVPKLDAVSQRSGRASTSEHLASNDSLKSVKRQSDESRPKNTKKRTVPRKEREIDKEESIRKQTAYFPPLGANSSGDWYLYKINTETGNRFGCIVPCELGKLPKFLHCINEKQIIVSIDYVKRIDYVSCKQQFDQFCRYIFEKIFVDMNTGPDEILQFDPDASTFKLLLCLLTEDNEVDFGQMESICTETNESIELSTKYKQCIALENSPKEIARELDDGKRARANNFVSADTIQLNQSRCQIFNKIEIAFIQHLPQMLYRITQVLNIRELKQNLLIPIDCQSASGSLDEEPPITLDNPFANTLSLETTLLLSGFDGDLVSKNKCGIHPPLGLVLQAMTVSTADRENNMKSLATLGDSFLKKSISLFVYHREPNDSSNNSSLTRESHITNQNLYKLANEKGLQHYLIADTPVYSGTEANWIPPGYKVNEDNAERYLQAKVKRKAFADVVEAMIGCYLVSTNYVTTMKFMQWLGLKVLVPSGSDQMNEAPSILRLKDGHTIKDIDQLYLAKKWDAIEKAINYTFGYKAHLFAALTHPSDSQDALTIHYNKLQFIGNPLYEFLITRYIFLTKKSTSAEKKDIELYVCRANSSNIEKTIDPPSMDVSSVFSNVFDALVGAIFLDTRGSLDVVWGVIFSLMKSSIGISI
ncbi:unnamed protein product [Adineta ricciae]|uniref:RNase III domain-containing protein n=1 Tax=Adineta ricciae TaxID=249248 RepID=A0A814KLN5_ADIRI|nr:unnamed protein product [Adineta ricciae]